MNFTVVRANIVNVAADAIVLPANEKLKEGSGTRDKKRIQRIYVIFPVHFSKRVQIRVHCTR